MSTAFACPHCAARLNTPEDAAVRVVICPECRLPVTIPAAAVPHDPLDVGQPVRRSRRQSASRLPTVVAVVAVAALVVVGLVAGLYLLASTPQDGGPVAAKAGGKGEAPKGSKPTSGDVPKHATTKREAPARPDRRWIEEARAELFAATKAYQALEPEPLGKRPLMTNGEYAIARMEAKSFMNRFPIDRPEMSRTSTGLLSPNKMASNASPLIPRTMSVLQREALLQWGKGHDDKFTNSRANIMPGLRPLLDPDFKKRFLLRPDWQERSRLFGDFARLTGSKESWSLLVPFDDLTGDEMNAAIRAVTSASATGLGSLTSEQRALLLKAGALEFFESLLPAPEKPR